MRSATSWCEMMFWLEILNKVCLKNWQNDRTNRLENLMKITTFWMVNNWLNKFKINDFLLYEVSWWIIQNYYQVRTPAKRTILSICPCLWNWIFCSVHIWHRLIYDISTCVTRGHLYICDEDKNRTIYFWKRNKWLQLWSLFKPFLYFEFSLKKVES